MLHIHFGAGRLGLGLVVPFFQTASSESYIFNRAVSSANPTGSTALAPRRRNDLLGTNSQRSYVLQQPVGSGVQRQVVRFDGFVEYAGDDIEAALRTIIDESKQQASGIIVTASLLASANYGPVLRALELLAKMKAQDVVGNIYFVACENTLNADQVFREADLCQSISPNMWRYVTRVHALVDRVCIGLEEGQEGSEPAVVVCTEVYGSLKLELTSETEALARQLEGSGVEFTRHVAVEKQLKSWLLNGSHWLLALAAFEERQGRQFNLNEFLRESPQHRNFAQTVMQEMCEGIAVILRREPEYASFVRDVDPEAYLQGSAKAIMARFLSNEDPITRILARFHAPTPEAPTSIEGFSKRFADRVDEPMAGFVEKRGFAPPAAAHSVQSLANLIASETYIDAA